MEEDKLRVGVIASTHGLAGEVKVYPTTEDPARFKKLKQVIVDTGKEEQLLEIENVKFFKNKVILKFKGIDTINDIERYKGNDLLIKREQAIPLQENEYFISDVIGSQVISDTGVDYGIVEEILTTGANDVYVVKRPDGRELLLPSIPDCILDINIEEKKVFVHLLPGLAE